MIKKIYSGHPYHFVRSLIESNLNLVSELTYSYYKYRPQSIKDERIVHNISSADFLDISVVERLIDETPLGHEMALHSTVRTIDGVHLHIPMVDMSTKSSVQIDKVAKYIGIDLFKSMKWYVSGRSYHGYGSVLVSQADWMAMMGKLLLVNQKSQPDNVDPRWVGHRLIAGYSALRWTKNTRYYVGSPTEK